MNPVGLLFVSSLVACGGARRADVQPPPAWRSEEGKEQARIDIAAALAENGNAESALAMVSELRRDGVKDLQLDLVQAQALRKLGLTDDAESVLLQVLKKRPRQPDAHDQLGVLYMDLKRFDDALVHLEKAVNLSSEDAGFRNNFGFALLTAGQPHRAVEQLREALRLNGSNTQVRNNLGFALVADGRDDEALRVFRAGQTGSDAQYNLGLGLELRGDEEAAVRAYAAALATEPTHSPALEALRRLRPKELHQLKPPALSPSPSPSPAPPMEAP